MGFSLINIGFGNMAAAARVMAIISPESAPVKRMIQDSRDSIDITHLAGKEQMGADLALQRMGMEVAHTCLLGKAF